MPSPLLSRSALVVVALLALVPFQFPTHYAPLPTFHSDAAAALLGVVCVAVALLVSRERAALPSITLPVAAFICVLAVQAALGRYAYLQQIELGILHAALLVGVALGARALAETLSPARLVGALAWGLAAGGVLAGAIAIVQVYDLRGVWAQTWILQAPNLQQTRRAYGNVGQANVLASYLALALAALLYLRVARRVPMPACVAAGVLMLVALCLTGSRLAAGYLVVGVTLAGTWALRQRTAAAGQSFRLAAAALAIFLVIDPVLIALGLGREGDSPILRLAALAEGQGGLATRLMLWRHAFAMLEDAPMLGVGFGGFAGRMFEQAAELSSGIEGVDRNAHNIILHVAAETGLAGLAAWVWCAVVVLSGLRRMAWSGERLFCATVLGVLALHSLFEFPLWYTNVLAVFAVVAGAVDANAPLRALGPQRVARRFASVMAAGGVLWLAVQWHAWGLVHPLIHPTWGVLREDASLPAVTTAVRGTLFESALDERIGLLAPADARGLPPLIAYLARSRRMAPTAGLVYREATLRLISGEEDAGMRLIADALVMFPHQADAYADALERAAKTHPVLDGVAAKVRAMNARNRSAIATR